MQDSSLPFDKQLPVFLIGPFSSQVLLFSHGMTAGVMRLLTSSCQVSIRLLDNGWENSAGKFKKRQTSSHRFSIPARRSMLLLRWNIAFLLMTHQELDQSPECHWMSVTLWSWQTNEGGKAVSTGCLYYELLEFLIWSGTSDDSGNLPNQGPQEPDQPPALGELLRSTEINIFLNPRWSTVPLAKIFSVTRRNFQ